MTKYETVVDFVKNKLPQLMDAVPSWENISMHPSFGRLAEKFDCYVRKREVNRIGSDFSKYPSLKAVPSGKTALILGYDSEWVDLKYPGEIGPAIGSGAEWNRFILSWQFSVVFGELVMEFVIVAKNVKYRLALLDALAFLFSYCIDPEYENAIDIRNVRKYEATVKTGDEFENKLFTLRSEAKKEAIGGAGGVRVVDIIDEEDHLNICLACHAGLVDLTALEKQDTGKIFKAVSSIQKGLVTQRPVLMCASLPDYKFKKHKHIYPFSINVRDTMCHAPAKSKKLSVLGDAIGYPKIDVDDSWKSRMDALLMNDPALYFDYAATDSTITVLYLASIYSENKLPPVTITSAAAKVMKKKISSYMNINPTVKGHFDMVYRGLRDVKLGTIKTHNFSIPFIQALDKEPLNDNAARVMLAASKSYHGGYNGCSEVGYFETEIPTKDYDLKAAYPTAMTLVPDVDWFDCLEYVVEEFDLDEVADALFTNATPIPFVIASIDSFEFPETVQFCCLPVVVEGIPIYPRKYDCKDEICVDVPGVYATGPELYLAHKLGAKVRVRVAYVLNAKYKVVNDEIVYSYSLKQAVKQMVADRAEAKKYAKENGIDSYLCESILKSMVNSCYGKVGQNVINKSTWSAYGEEMVDIGPSSITNPVSAAFITAIVRCVLIAVQNECVNAGYKVFSVTTDGFISDVPENVLKDMDMYGFKNVLNLARLYLTDGESDEIWETKHQQNDLLNFTTRGNVSLSKYGVCAHNGAKSGLSDDVEDRKWLMKSVLGRTGKVSFKEEIWSSLKDVVLGKVTDFTITPRTRAVSMDFDCKRKPVRSSFKVVEPVIDEEKFEIACFATVPYENIGEYKKYRNLAKRITSETKRSPCHALRTRYDWELYFFKRLEIMERTAKNKAARQSSANSGVTSNADNNAEDIKANAKPRKIKACVTNTSKDSSSAKKVRNCIYAHYAKIITIPLLAKHTVPEFTKILNKSGITESIFAPGDIKNYSKSSRWPYAIRSNDIYLVQKFMQEQEPVLTKILELGDDAKEDVFDAQGDL